MTSKFMRAGLVLGGLTLAACQSVPETALRSGLETGFAAGSTTAPVRPEQAGYRLVGDGFSSELVFEDEAGEARAAIRHHVPGADPVLGELRFGEPWLADGAHEFSGRSDTGLPLDIVLEPGPCEAGGASYGYFARVQAGRLTYSGCASETGPYRRWSNGLGDYLDAISACQSGARTSAVMHFAGSGSRMVIHARAEGPARVVRYEFPGSGRFDCRVEYGQVQWRPVDGESPVLASERDPVFLPGVWPEAGEGCMLYARVRDSGGGLIGALGYDVCTAAGPAGAPDSLG